MTSFQAIQPPYLLQATHVAIPVLDNDNNLTYFYMSSISTLRKLILQMTSSRIPLQSGESASKFDGTLHIVRSRDETILAYENSSYTPRSLHVHSQLHHIHPSELCFLGVWHSDKATRKLHSHKIFILNSQHTFSSSIFHQAVSSKSRRTKQPMFVAGSP